MKSRRALLFAPRRRRLRGHTAGLLLVFLLALATVGASARPAEASQAGLQRILDGILVRSHFTGPRVAVRVVDLDSGQEVYERHEAAALAPASNEKLVTSAAALGLWGADYRFKTELYTSAAPGADGVLHGNVYIKGYGDPTLSETWYQQRVLHAATANIADFVTALKSLGITRITGNVLGDESWFDSVRTVAGWKADFALECAPLSALTLNGNAPNGRNVARPARYAAQELVRLLRAAGIRVNHSGGEGVVPSTARLISTVYSAPLWRVLRIMDKRSDNFIAEMLAKGLGKDFGAGGTTLAGMAVVRRYLASLGVSLARIRLQDGSGLSYHDRLNTVTITQLLQVESQRSDFNVYLTALPVAGVDGTLGTRMRGTKAARNLRAKTGTLNIASCLSGYVTTVDHHRLAFSILMNGVRLNTWAARQAQDAIGAALAAAHL